MKRRSFLQTLVAGALAWMSWKSKPVQAVVHAWTTTPDFTVTWKVPADALLIDLEKCDIGSPIRFGPLVRSLVGDWRHKVQHPHYSWMYARHIKEMRMCDGYAYVVVVYGPLDTIYRGVRP